MNHFPGSRQARASKGAAPLAMLPLAASPRFFSRRPKLKSPSAIAGESHAIAFTPGRLLLPLVNHFS